MTTGPARPPAVAGQFYEEDGAALARQVEACFLDARGPGALPTRHRSAERTLRAAIVPHAGYPYSGPIAAHVYARVAAERPPDTVLVLGVDHGGLGPLGCLSDRDWRTPLGPTAVDHELVAALHRPPMVVDEAAQAFEHSIEVQLPFLEYVLPRPRFVPLQVRFGRFAELEKVAEVVRAAVAGRDALLLASKDLSHYVPARTAERLDGLALDAMLARDPRRLYATVVENDISMCGIAPTTVLLLALAGARLSARLLRWGHSGEVRPMRDVVGYAALVLEKSDGGAPSVK
jgi:MEMO1 family protein